MAGFLGRSDQMVKLRGINVFPQALGPILSDLPGFTGEFLCEVTRDSNGRDEMCVSLELSAASDEQLLAMAKERLRASLGVEVQTRACAPGELAARTGIESRQKPVRLLDLRFS
jgi:phenylacetate-CoA ligase